MFLQENGISAMENRCPILNIPCVQDVISSFKGEVQRTANFAKKAKKILVIFTLYYTLNSYI